MTGADEPEYYRLLSLRAEDWSRGSALILKTTLPQDSVKRWLEEQVAALDPTVPVRLQATQERVNRMADRPRFESMLVSFFEVVGVSLAMIGLYGVLAFLVAQREREIGVRMALGARRREILQLVVRRSMRLIVCGVVIGIVLALIASRALAHMLFNISPWDPESYLATIALLVIVGLFATWLPARSACNVDPAVALRAE